MTLRWPGLIAFFLLALPTVSHGQERLSYIAPTDLTNGRSQMKTPGFWISHHPSPDRIIFTPEEIAELNLRIQDELKLTKDIFALPPLTDHELREQMERPIADFKDEGYFMAGGTQADTAYFESQREAMNLNAIPVDIRPEYGLVVRYADQRFFPTKEGLYAQRFDIDFDELQNSSLDVGTPVVILHRSSDGKWLFVETQYLSGWVEADKIAVGNIREVKRAAIPRKTAVAVAAKAELYWDKTFTEYHDYVRMSTPVPLIKSEDGVLQFLIPVRSPEGKLILETAYGSADQWIEGYLPYTARAVFTQAFKLLNAPYGWGGMYGEQDCSAFLQEVFGVFGIRLPRNSSQQREVGRLVTEFGGQTTVEAKSEAFKNLNGGINILNLKGHIMLYLGTVDGEHYAIHAVWAYREPADEGKDRVRVINRVAVTDLSLGEGSRKGSLLKRITSIRSIGP